MKKIEEMSIKELEKRIEEINNIKGVVSNEEIKELHALRIELSWKYNFKQ